jgi:hypothetical protein
VEPLGQVEECRPAEAPAGEGPRMWHLVVLAAVRDLARSVRPPRFMDLLIRISGTEG